MSEPSPLARSPHVIPYVEHHVGPRRPLTLELTRSSAVPSRPPIVSIDGRQYIVVWGAVTFEIPGDRNVHVSVHVESEGVAYSASTILVPDPEPVRFGYSASWGGGGALTPIHP